jgi:hypothetical protein
MDLNTWENGINRVGSHLYGEQVNNTQRWSIIDSGVEVEVTRISLPVAQTVLVTVLSGGDLAARRELEMQLSEFNGRPQVRHAEDSDEPPIVLAWTEKY